jgi:hypothetical protein
MSKGGGVWAAGAAHGRAGACEGPGRGPGPVRVRALGRARSEIRARRDGSPQPAGRPAVPSPHARRSPSPRGTPPAPSPPSRAARAAEGARPSVRCARGGGGQVGMGAEGASMQVMAGAEVLLELVVADHPMEALSAFFAKLSK